jgi:septum formation inhibitor-activating ATPase MinD
MKNAVIHTHPKSRAARQYLDSAQRILGREVRFESPLKVSFFSRMVKVIRRN